MLLSKADIGLCKKRNKNKNKSPNPRTFILLFILHACLAFSSLHLLISYVFRVITLCLVLLSMFYWV